MHLKHLAFLLSLLLFSGCGTRTADTASDNGSAGSGYFSIRQFAADQFATHRGVPFVIEQLMFLNGDRDSSVLNSYNADWEPILRILLSTDISHSRFTDQYDAVLFNDGNGANVLYYTAKHENLFTRLLQIRVDAATNRIRSLYIETEKKSFWNKTMQKLYYIPMKLIQIQEFSKPLMGKGKELRVEYRFML